MSKKQDLTAEKMLLVALCALPLLVAAGCRREEVVDDHIRRELAEGTDGGRWALEKITLCDGHSDTWDMDGDGEASADLLAEMGKTQRFDRMRIAGRLHNFCARVMWSHIPAGSAPPELLAWGADVWLPLQHSADYQQEEFDALSDEQRDASIRRTGNNIVNYGPFLFPGVCGPNGELTFNARLFTKEGWDDVPNSFIRSMQVVEFTESTIEVRVDDYALYDFATHAFKPHPTLFRYVRYE